MRVGSIRAVGPNWVQKIADTRWIVMTPDLEVVYVDEDPEAFGWLGPEWATDCVLIAEVMGDTREVPALA